MTLSLNVVIQLSPLLYKMGIIQCFELSLLKDIAHILIFRKGLAGIISLFPKEDCDRACINPYIHIIYKFIY